MGAGGDEGVADAVVGGEGELGVAVAGAAWFVVEVD